MGNGREIRGGYLRGASSGLFLGAGVGKLSDSECGCVILVPDNYGGKINQIEIPHERAMRRNGALTEAEQSILRSGLGELMWIARTARAGAIYDAAAAARNFSDGKMADSMIGK